MSLLSGLLGDPGARVWVRLRSDELRQQYQPLVWDQYQEVYSKLGPLNVGDPSLLMEFDDWHLLLGADDSLHAFALSRMTIHGEKVGAMGSDGTASGKMALRDHFRDVMRTEGYWGEASHATLALARKLRLPKVCPEFAAILLPGKKLTPGSTPGSYIRTITGVGPVEKVLIGRPIGLPTVFDESQCTTEVKAVAGLRGLQEPDFDLVEHYSSFVV